jgi:hypothetical protein
MVRIRVPKSLYRIRQELAKEGIEDDAEVLKRLVRQAVQRSKRRRPSAEEGAETERDEGQGARDKG